MRRIQKIIEIIIKFILKSNNNNFFSIMTINGLKNNSSNIRMLFIGFKIKSLTATCETLIRPPYINDMFYDLNIYVDMLIEFNIFCDLSFFMFCLGILLQAQLVVLYVCVRVYCPLPSQISAFIFHITASFAFSLH